ncbi:alpha/beta hydrolase [Leptospira sp. GIMC2001]|uniref:alpha/beta hydrolase n=1 Tax=Leptospira sp. GIMC2001 TaxID=1513297 RepID=UPI00234BCCF2|nr:alpha/beta hydrolase [Leptospira sp. GIMC2001]WCL48950.1 alpha/beta hydrolase [Leptospira sp. GIMC2001]
MKKAGKIFGGVIGFLAVVITTTYYIDYPSYSYEHSTLPATFEEFYDMKLAESKAKNARPGNNERLVRYSKGKTPIAILYIHGFGASRGEGEYVGDAIAEKFKANLYYLRLPGHGTNIEDHRETGFQEYLKTAEDTFLMMDRLGDKVVVIGTSMGGLLSTYLASKYPDKIHGLILASPFYDFRDKSGNVYSFIWGKQLVNTLYGDLRKNKKNDRDDAAFNYWYRDQYYEAVQNISNLKRVIANSEVYEKVTVPVLMFYYYKSEEDQDSTADVSRMLEVFDEFGKATQPNPLNKKVQIENGAHVLMSEYVKSDKELIIKEIEEFITKIK